MGMNIPGWLNLSDDIPDLAVCSFSSHKFYKQPKVLELDKAKLSKKNESKEQKLSNKKVM